MAKLEIYAPIDEKPLDHIVEGYSYTSILRNIAFVGDSLSSGEFETFNSEDKPCYHDMYEYSWGQFIARKNGLTAYNFSCGGMTAKFYAEYYAAAKGFWSTDKACKAYVIALGVNDIYNNKMEVGSLEDIDSEDYKKNKPTFAGFYAQIISKYKEICPEAKFFFVTFPKEDDAEKQKMAQDVRKLLYDFSEHFDNCYVLDIYEYGPVFDEKFKERYFLHGHMNPMGYLLFAKMIDSYMDYIIRHNMDDFKFTGLINSNIDYK